MMNKLLITGASGFTGQHACSHFVNAGFEVTAVTRKKPVNKLVRVEQCDLTDKSSVDSLVKRIKPDYLLHLAGQNSVEESWRDPIKTIETNILSTLYLIEALRQENPNCKTIIVGSALQFDTDNVQSLLHPYSLSKSLQVLVAQSWEVLYNMHIVIAKPSNLIGPGITSGVCSVFAKKIAEMEHVDSPKIIEVNNLQSQRDFLDVRDAVKAYEVLLLKGKSGEIYEIGSGRSCSLSEVIVGYQALTKIEFGAKSLVMNKEEERVHIPIKKINALGWTAKIPLESSLKDILFYQREKLTNNEDI
ncbi:UDP-4-keto-6-deoxy-GlcNAc-4-reductase [Cytobacillus horneckiae]